MRERLAELIKALGISQKEFSESVELSPAYTSDLLNGRKQAFAQETLVKIVARYRVNLNWLLNDLGPMFAAPPESPERLSSSLDSLSKSERKVIEDMISILSKRSGPVVQPKPEVYSHSEVREIVELGSVAAGPLTSEEVTAGKKIQFPRALIPERGPLYALRVRGDSMIDANIHDGDYAIIRPVPQPQELKAGTIVVALVNGENTLKRLYRADHGATLRAANDRYPDIQVTKFQDLVIQGELRYLLKKIDGDGNGT